MLSPSELVFSCLIDINDGLSNVTAIGEHFALDTQYLNMIWRIFRAVTEKTPVLFFMLTL